MHYLSDTTGTPEVEMNGVLESVRELGIGCVSYAPLGRGLLTGGVPYPVAIAGRDLRHILPRFRKENPDADLALVERIARTATDPR
ncbi:hypothetical protein [Streptomyces sp. NBC_01497]|uniref:hypothetical protein n=1 Tax=Streptomyces sp. NBC_01497 TaxID=2903885 RepID=UPI002E366347|nr:hypothetical protein [Streptomyces sp. NBC_01497]